MDYPRHDLAPFIQRCNRIRIEFSGKILKKSYNLGLLNCGSLTNSARRSVIVLDCPWSPDFPGYVEMQFLLVVSTI